MCSFHMQAAWSVPGPESLHSVPTNRGLLPGSRASGCSAADEHACWSKCFIFNINISKDTKSFLKKWKFEPDLIKKQIKQSVK